MDIVGRGETSTFWLGGLSRTYQLQHQLLVGVAVDMFYSMDDDINFIFTVDNFNRGERSTDASHSNSN